MKKYSSSRHHCSDQDILGFGTDRRGTLGPSYFCPRFRFHHQCSASKMTHDHHIAAQATVPITSAVRARWPSDHHIAAQATVPITSAVRARSPTTITLLPKLQFISPVQWWQGDPRTITFVTNDPLITIIIKLITMQLNAMVYFVTLFD